MMKEIVVFTADQKMS